MSHEEAFKVTDRRSRGASASDAPSPGVAEGDHGNAETAGSGPDRNDLSSLLMMFATSALVSLGVAPDPQTHESPRDLARAQAAIDVLLMLREKTNGNRTEQESRLLEGLLYDLQMRFVSVVREARTGS